MAKKKACKKCKIFVDKDQCPICGAQGSQLSTSWQGRINVIDKDNSKIAQNMGLEKNGEYAIKVR